MTISKRKTHIHRTSGLVRVTKKGNRCPLPGRFCAFTSELPNEWSHCTEVVSVSHPSFFPKDPLIYLQSLPFHHQTGQRTENQIIRTPEVKLPAFGPPFTFLEDFLSVDSSFKSSILGGVKFQMPVSRTSIRCKQPLPRESTFPGAQVTPESVQGHAQELVGFLTTQKLTM